MALHDLSVESIHSFIKYIVLAIKGPKRGTIYSDTAICGKFRGNRVFQRVKSPHENTSDDEKPPLNTHYSRVPCSLSEYSQAQSHLTRSTLRTISEHASGVNIGRSIANSRPYFGSIIRK